MEVTKDMVRRSQWDSAITIEISLARDEVTTLERPLPIFATIERWKSLYTLCKTVRDQFQHLVVPVGSSHVWFEYRGIPLKSHVPVGCLVDSLSVTEELPWPVCVRFTKFPAKEVLPVAGSSDLEWIFLNAMKEAMYVQYGSTKAIMTMSKSDQEQLWTAISTGDYELHSRILGKILPLDAHQTRKRYAIRFYLWDGTVRQVPVNVADAGNMTLKDAVALIADVIPSVDVERLMGRTIINGLSLPSDTPLAWIVDTFVHPDNFVYICVRP